MDLIIDKEYVLNIEFVFNNQVILCVVPNHVFNLYIKYNYPILTLANQDYVMKLASSYLVFEIYKIFTAKNSQFILHDYELTTSVNEANKYAYSLKILLPLYDNIKQELEIFANSQKQIDYINNIFHPIILQLEKHAPIHGLINLNYRNLELILDVQEKLTALTDIQQSEYKKIILSLNNNKIEFLLHEKYEPFITTQFIEILKEIKQISSIDCKIISISKTQISKNQLIQMDFYIQSELISIFFVENIFLVNLFKKLISPKELVIDKNFNIDLNVFIATVNLTIDEINSLKEGDILLCDAMIAQSVMFIDCDKYLFSADISDNKLTIKSKMLVS